MRVGDEREYRDEGGETPLLQTDAQYPVWEWADWTHDQRTTAIRGLLFLALGAGVIAGCLAAWATFAATLLAPLGATLIYLGVVYLHTLFWYPYWNGVTTLGERRGQAAVMVVFIRVENYIAWGTLALQLLGVIALAVAGPGGLWGIDAYVWAWLMALPMVGCGVVGYGSFVSWYTSGWVPQRDPERGPAAAVALVPASGVRRALRWLTMLVALGSLALVAAPPLALGFDYSYQVYGISAPYLSKEPALFALGAALCFILALSELTNRERTAIPGAN